MDKLLKVQEVAYRLGVSNQTVGIWYKFKRENPDNEYSMLLPDFTRKGQTRYWNESDVEALKYFQRIIPQGRNGVLGSVTQRYVKKSDDSKPVRVYVDPEKTAKTMCDNYILKVEGLLKFNNVDIDVIEQVKDLLNSEYGFRRGLY